MPSLLMMQNSLFHLSLQVLVRILGGLVFGFFGAQFDGAGVVGVDRQGAVRPVAPDFFSRHDGALAFPWDDEIMGS